MLGETIENEKYDTVFGRAKFEKNNRSYEISIKSVNSKYLDINVKLPFEINYVENEIKKVVSSKVSRGKIDIIVLYENYSNEGKEIIVNKSLVNNYINVIDELTKENSKDRS